MSEQDLDTRIRTLVARAVADAPAPPDLENLVVQPHDPHPDHRRWWVGGGAAALLAAAAVVTAVVLVADTEDRISTPATVPTTTPAPAPATTVSGGTVPNPTAAEAPTTTTSTTLPEPVTEEIRQQIVTAGPGGVVARGMDGADQMVLLTEPARRALAIGDGRVLVELGTAEAATGHVVWNNDAAPFDPFADVSGVVTIHDIAVIDGTPTLLYDVDAGDDEPDATLYVAPITGPTGVDLDAATEIAFVSAPEYGVNGLTLASNGLVVGESTSDGVTGLWVRAIPGTRGQQVTDELSLERLGLEESYDRRQECQCPTAFTVDETGERLAWVDGEDAVVKGLDGTEVRRIPLGDAAADYLDLDLLGDLLAVSYLFDTRPPLLVNPDGSSLTLEGSTADIGPAAGGDATLRPPTTSSANVVVTAGSDGVAVLDGVTEVRRLDQAAEVAVMTPGGAVIFQPARAMPEGEPGDPLIWRADGTTERLLGELPAGQSYRLYDVADVAGVPTVLYGLRTTPADGNPEGYREALHALAMAPGDWSTTPLHEIHTWEGGYSHLSLSGDGLVVGETGEGVSHGLFSVAVPGSPAAATGPLAAATLGVQDVYGDEPSPTAFAVSSDGALVAWVERDQFVVHTIATGAQRRWTSPDLDLLVVRGIDVRAIPDVGIAVLVNTSYPGQGDAVALDYVLGDEEIVDGETLGVAFASSAP